jgi:hypothetical protein
VPTEYLRADQPSTIFALMFTLLSVGIGGRQDYSSNGAGNFAVEPSNAPAWQKSLLLTHASKVSADVGKSCSE